MNCFGTRWVSGKKARWIALVFVVIATLYAYVHLEANRLRPAIDALQSSRGEYYYSYIEEWCRSTSDPMELAKRARDADTWDYHWLGLSGRLAAYRAGYPFNDLHERLVGSGMDWYAACMSRLAEIGTKESLSELLSVYLHARMFNDGGFSEDVVAVFADKGQSALDAIDRYVPESDRARFKLECLRQVVVQVIAERSGK